MFGHTSWHLALFELGRGRQARAMEIYETAIGPAVCTHRSTLNNSASFLWRCMVYGYAPAAARWDELQPLAGGISGPARGEWDGMNAALAFAGAGNEAGKNDLVAGIRKLGEGGRTTAVEVGLPLVEGRLGVRPRRLRRGDPVRWRRRSGASRASAAATPQHEVFWDALIEAYLRTGRFAEAEDLQTGRLHPRATVRDLFRLGRAQIGTGKAEEGTGNLRCAAEGWRDADSGSPELAAIDRLLERAEPAAAR